MRMKRPVPKPQPAPASLFFFPQQLRLLSQWAMKLRQLILEDIYNDRTSVCYFGSHRIRILQTKFHTLNLLAPSRIHG